MMYSKPRELQAFSRALWIPLLWLLMSASRGRISPERLGVAEVYEGNLALRLFFSALIVLGLLVLFRRNIGIKELIRRNPWVLALFLLMAASILYSAFPWVSLKRWIKTAGVVIMALLVLTEREPIKAFEALIRRFCFIAIPLSFFLIFFLPQYGTKYYGTEKMMWIGIATHKNTLGLSVLIAAAYFTWVLFFRGRQAGQRRFWDFAVLAMSLVMLTGCGSMTSLFSYFAAVATMVVAGLGRTVRAYVGPILGFLAVTALVLYVLMEALSGTPAITNSVVESFGRNTTFTGRMELWTAVWSEAVKHPILGHGFGGFWVGEIAKKLWEVHDWKPIDSHNGYIDVFNELGLVGIVILGILILSTYARIARGFVVDFQYARLLMALFVMVLVHNLNETSLLNLNHPFWFLFLFASLLQPADLAAYDADAEQSHVNKACATHRLVCG